MAEILAGPFIMCVAAENVTEVVHGGERIDIAGPRRSLPSSGRKRCVGLKLRAAERADTSSTM